jgi:hypothetical protein
MKSKLGYKRNSPDKNRPFNIIPSGRITMKEDNGTPLKKGPILGIDNLGNYEMMYPGMEYQFPGNEVFEIPMAQLGAENRKESGQKDLSYKWSEPMSKRSLPISYTKVQKGGWLENLPKAQVGLEQKFTSSDVPKNINPNELRPENFINENEYITYFKNLERYACGFEGCANFANNYAGRVVGLTGKSYQDFLNQGQKTGATGNAWQNYGYTLDLGGKDIFNAYRGSGSIEDVKPGDLIGLQHKNRTVYSGNYDIEGTDAPKAGVRNSHTGVVDYVKTNEDGSKNIYIRHNIGGKAIFDEIQVNSKGNPVIRGGWNVVTAARPNFGNFSPEFTYDESSQEWKLNPYVSDYNPDKSIGLSQKTYDVYSDIDPTEQIGYENNPIIRNQKLKKEKARLEKNPGTRKVDLFNKDMVKALDSLNNNKKALMDYYKMSDDEFNNLAIQVVATAGVESQFGTSKKEKLKTDNPELVSLAKGDLETLARSFNTKGRKRLERFGENSLGMFQVKPYSIDPYFIDVFDLGSMKKFSEPEGNVLAAFDHLYRDQKKAKDLASRNTGLQTEELKDPSNLSYAVYNTPGRVAAGDITAHPDDPTKYANKKLRRYLEYKKEIPAIFNQESGILIDPNYTNLPEINIVSEKQKGGTNRTVKWLDKLQEGEEVPTIGPIDLPAVEISDKADPRALMNQGSFFGDTNNRYTTQFKETGVPQIFTDYAVAEMAKERQAAEPQLPMTLEEYQKQMGTIGLPSTDISAPFVDPNTGEVDYGKMGFAALEGIASGFVGASTPKVPKTAVNYLQPTKLVLPPGFNPYTLGKSNTQITSTLTGSNLEKQLSKTGEINRNVILTHIGKRDTPSSDKTIIQRVLDEDFPNQSKIDYREFKKAIDNKIVSLNKDVLVDQYSNYGIQSLGYSGVSRKSYEQALKNQEMGINALTDDIAKMQKDPNYKSSTWPHYKLEDIQKLLAETIETYNKTKADLESIPESKTIKFSNKQEFGTGDAKHFPDDPYALGHARYFINPKQPNIFNLLENQSDFSQGSGSVLKKNLRREDYVQRKERRISSLENDVANYEKALKHMKETGTDYFGAKVYDWNIKDIEEHISSSKKRLEDAKADFKNTEQKALLTDSYFDRQLQETVQYAAENGQNIVRVPTKETATKIQGYKPISEPVKPEQAEKLKKAIAHQKEMLKNKRNPDGTSMDKSDIAHYEMNIQGLEEELNMTLKYDQKHETILKKYTEQPKIIKKLFGAAPRTVTDDKGNTWYEFDIPKSYLEGKGEIKAYKLGGQKGGWLDKLQGGKEVKKKIPQGNLVEPGEDFVDISSGKKPWQRIFAEENADISRPLILGEIPIFASGVTLPNFGDLSQDDIFALQQDGPLGTAAALKATGRYKDKGSYGESIKNFSAFPITASSQMLQTPQSVMVEGIEALRGRPYSFQNALPFSGKQRVPSETFGITNPYLGFAADVLMDPENLIPSAFAKNLMENVFKQGLKKGITTTGKNIFSSVPKFNFSNALENTKDQLSKALKGTSSIINEIKGELYQGKLNRESIKKGNEWLENWIKHPATQQKIDTDIDKRIDFIKDYFIDPTDEINTHELIRTQAKNYKPDSKEYSLLKQLDDNVQQYLSKKSRSPIHQGNWGVSYKHGYGPNTREAIELGLKKPDSRYGSWITRRVSLPQSKRVSTTIHEGAHDWVSEEAFRKSGMRNEALKHINPNIKKDLLEYENWTSIGVNPIEKMGKERAYMAYLADPTEQHARIMELRHGLDLSPDFVMDEGTASRVIDWIDKGDSKIDPKFLDVIDRDPKKLAALFNNFWAISPYITLGGLGAYGYKQYNNQAEYQKGGQKRLKKQKSGWLDNLNN